MTLTQQLAVIVLSLVWAGALVLLTGCAAPGATAVEAKPAKFAGVCGLTAIGQSEEGITFVFAVCEERKP